MAEETKIVSIQTAPVDAGGVPAATTTTTVTQKPGYKTTEFWLTLVGKLVALAAALGVIPVDTVEKAVAVLGVVLGGFGYSIARGMAKAPPKVGILLVLWIGAMNLSACACATVEHRNDFTCAVVRNIVDCTEPAVETLVGQFAPVVRALINSFTGSGGDVDWSGASAAIDQFKIKDGGCILAKIAADIGAKPAAGERGLRQSKTYQEGFAAFRAKRWPGVQFKVSTEAGATTL